MRLCKWSGKKGGQTEGISQGHARNVTNQTFSDAIAGHLAPPHQEIKILGLFLT